MRSSRKVAEPVDPRDAREAADLKWHGYEPTPEVTAVEEFLAVVKKDEYSSFFG